MSLTRRHTLALGVAGAAALAAPRAADADAADLIQRFTGGVATAQGDLVLIAPEIAENGQSVTIEVSCPGAEQIRLLAPANPNPEVCTFIYGPLSADTQVVTRIRMAETQEMIALARMTDGTYREARATVRVTIGGCGG
jgi:sulfur-oxidizing protein SoxY